jgi:hypothetical protein
VIITLTLQKSIGLGAKEFKALGDELKKCQDTNSPRDWATAATYSGISQEFLFARLYVNKASFATQEIAALRLTRKTQNEHSEPERMPGTATFKL